MEEAIPTRTNLRTDFAEITRYDYDCLKEGFLTLGELPGAVVRHTVDKTYISKQDTYVDMDTPDVFPFIIAANGTIRQLKNGVESMALRYRMMTYHPSMADSSVNHTLRLEVLGEDVLRHVHHLKACPEKPSPRNHPRLGAEARRQADEGGALLLACISGWQPLFSCDVQIMTNELETWREAYQGVE